MSFNEDQSSFWTLGGLGLWVIVLVIPVLLYFAIAAFQRIWRPKEGPRFTLEDHDDLDKPVKPLDKGGEQERRIS